MRALLLIASVAALVACSPEIVPGAYLCGPDEACPSNQACDGPTNSCVDPGTAMPFECDPMIQHEPDETPAEAFPITGLMCVTPAVILDGCLAAADTQNWLSLVAPTGCSAVQIQARMTFPVAFEPITYSLWDLATATPTMVAAGATCPESVGAPPAGDDQQCFTLALTGGTTYGIQVAPVGGGDCDGQCNYNNYELTLLINTQ